MIGSVRAAQQPEVGMTNRMRAMLGDALTPAARAWIRYSPLDVGKPWLWQTFHWRRRAFTCKTRFGGRITRNNEDLIPRHPDYFRTWGPNINQGPCAKPPARECFGGIAAHIRA